VAKKIKKLVKSWWSWCR